MAVKLRDLKFYFSLAAMLLLVGCPLSVEIGVYNDSPRDLVVFYLDGQTADWPRGSTISLDESALNKMAWLEQENKNIKYPVLEIGIGKNRLRYPLSGAFGLQGDYVKIDHKVKIFLKLNIDGNLYVVDKATGMLVKPQPAGFPIKPI